MLSQLPQLHHPSVANRFLSSFRTITIINGIASTQKAWEGREREQEEEAAL